jgi:hypothetical protein
MLTVTYADRRYAEYRGARNGLNNLERLPLAGISNHV